MRPTVKLRLSYLVLAISSYFIAFGFTPSTLTTITEQYLLAAISILLFILLPLCYWRLLITTKLAKPWRVLVILGLSGLVARFTYPAQFSSYFEFLMWLRYPIMAVILIAEVLLLVTVIQGLWRSRKQSADPRLSVALNEDYKQEEAKQSMALVVAGEPASWLYLNPRLSRKLPPALTQLHSYSASRWHWLLLTLTTLLLAGGAYFALQLFSPIAAIVVSSFIAYSLIFVTAHHRAARHHSIYVDHDNLVINVGLWGLLVLPINAIDSLYAEANTEPNTLHLGKANAAAAITLRLAEPQTYFSGLGFISDQVDTVTLHLDNAQPIFNWHQQRPPMPALKIA
ncbi:hypothetical protein [uncultured Ferrimonas sp.]|uniref:hypothetical protein n=1 Tax=uncultured Ferrimonas sp. TaxID=432640 RepID=UPI0026339AFC|nr:hypothetical protein [uncultured Ferrimonas sp.]